jgi:hypothetical protein
MTNALRYTPEGTPIEVAVGVRPVMEGRSDAVLAVIDHGNGIPEADARRIFERFYRADSSRQRETGGTGLGLAIVAAIAKQHDGGVRLSDTAGGGATMSLHVPYVPGAETSSELLQVEDAPESEPRTEPETATGVLQRLRAVTRKASEATRRVGEATRKATDGHRHDKRRHGKGRGTGQEAGDGSGADGEGGPEPDGRRDAARASDQTSTRDTEPGADPGSDD